MESLRSTPHSPFRSRRSHPALNHLSLAPLTPRFPIDDTSEIEDYFSGSHVQTTSYLSSSSVPSTPPILSHSRASSRASSRTRVHRRSKSTTHVLSDTDLHSLGAEHKSAASGNRKSRSRTPGGRSDSEWLFRAGLALASSTREEKGQSWLVKRESSTSLVAEQPDATELRPHHRHGRSTPRSRSGYSTPAAHSRQTSRSRGGSRRASRGGAELSMTAIDAVRAPYSSSSRKSSIDSPHALVPDFVDEQIRAEMAASMRRRETDEDDDYASLASSSDFDTDSDDDLDENEFRRLTRERGFGLGSWVDQFIGWTVFGVEDDYPSSPPGTSAERTVTFAASSDRPVVDHEDQEEDEDEADPLDEEMVSPIEKPGDAGGWADASWFLRLASKALV